MTIYACAEYLEFAHSSFHLTPKHLPLTFKSSQFFCNPLSPTIATYRILTSLVWSFADSVQVDSRSNFMSAVAMLCLKDSISYHVSPSSCPYSILPPFPWCSSHEIALLTFSCSCTLEKWIYWCITIWVQYVCVCLHIWYRVVSQCIKIFTWYYINLIDVIFKYWKLQNFLERKENPGQSDFSKVLIKTEENIYWNFLRSYMKCKT